MSMGNSKGCVDGEKKRDSIGVVRCPPERGKPGKMVAGGIRKGLGRPAAKKMGDQEHPTRRGGIGLRARLAGHRGED